MQGVATQVSATNISTACIVAFKKKLDTLGIVPSMLSIRDILLHAVFARANFLTTAGQLSSVAKVVGPRYLKERSPYPGGSHRR